MKAKQLQIGAMLSYLQMALQIIIGIIYTPIMLRLLGQSEYGLYNTVSSTISTLGILSLGFGSSYIKYYTKFKKTNSIVDIHRLNGLFAIVFSVIGCIALFCGIFLINHLDIVFKDGLTLIEMRRAKVLMILLTANLSISFPMSIFSSVISANEKFILQKSILIIQTILSPCITIPILLMGAGSIGLVVVSVCLNLFTWGINMFYCLSKLQVRFIFAGIDKKLFLSLFSYSAFIAINLIVDQINLNIDKILLARYRGTNAVAVYSIGFTLYMYYQNFSTAISNVFTPRIHAIVNDTRDDLKEMRNALTDIFTVVGRIQYLVLAFIITGFMFFGCDFIVKIWAGQEYGEAYLVALLLMIPATVPLIQNLGIEIQRAQNKHQFRSIIYGIMAVINLLISIKLCQIYGPIGSAAGTALSLIVANGIIMNFFYHKKCNINIVHFWKEILLLSRGLCLPVLIGLGLNAACHQMRFYFLKIVLYTVVYWANMWVFGMNSTEKQYIRNLKRKVKR